ncbi:MAG: hypothetical protein Q4C46_11290 [Bacillota bacterium]|nr:hypothetical protein [Bacillota bacterium]
MKGRLVEEFLEYAKEQYGYDISLKSSDTPDTFESIFGESFITQKKSINIIACRNNILVYDDKCDSVIFTNKQVSKDTENDSMIFAA